MDQFQASPQSRTPVPSYRPLPAQPFWSPSWPTTRKTNRQIIWNKSFLFVWPCQLLSVCVCLPDPYPLHLSSMVTDEKGRLPQYCLQSSWPPGSEFKVTFKVLEISQALFPLPWSPPLVALIGISREISRGHKHVEAALRSSNFLAPFGGLFG